MPFFSFSLWSQICELLCSSAEPPSFLFFSFVIYVILLSYFCFLVMVSSPRKCQGVEAEVCGRFLPSKEHDPYQLCIALHGKSCSSVHGCEECHDWSDERCNRDADYVEKLLLQCEMKEERKVEASSSSSSFSSFSASMPAAVFCGFRCSYNVCIDVVFVCGDVVGSGFGRHHCPICASIYCDAH